MEVKSGVSAGSVNQAASHTLYTEGSGSDAIDPRALARLLRDTGISVKPLGPCYHVKSAAQALHPHHPNYYFLVDRDHHDDAAVDESWNNFPDPKTHNLLIWRKRELENYFLDPDYLSQSRFLTKPAAKVKARLLKLATDRVFFDLANQTIATIREMQKSNWITDFTNPAEFRSSDEAIQQLKNCSALTARPATVAEHLEPQVIEKLYHAFETTFLGDNTKPAYGQGCWLDRMRGKPILATIVNECFRVSDTDGNVLTGKEAVTLVAEDLVDRDISLQPDDFQDLQKLIAERISEKP